jgi:hypothetical protein
MNREIGQVTARHRSWTTESCDGSWNGLPPSKNVWPICGQNFQHATDTRWQRMGRDVKTLVNPWWLQLLKRQLLTFLPSVRFGTERSEVQILSPRPIWKYGRQALAAVFRI